MHVNAGKGRREQGPRLGGSRAGGHDLVVEADDAGHPQGQRHGMPEVRRIRGEARDRQHVQGAPGPQVGQVSHPLVDHHRTRVGWIVLPSSQHPHPVNGAAGRTVQARRGVRIRVRRPMPHQHRHAEQDCARHGGHLRQPTHRRIEPGAATAASGQALLAGHDEDLARLGPAQHPRIGGIGALRPGGSGQHHATDQADQQHHGQHRPPALPQVSVQDEPGRCHGKIQLHRAAGRQGC